MPPPTHSPTPPLVVALVQHGLEPSCSARRARRYLSRSADIEPELQNPNTHELGGPTDTAGGTSPTCPLLTRTSHHGHSLRRAQAFDPLGAGRKAYRGLRLRPATSRGTRAERTTRAGAWARPEGRRSPADSVRRDALMSSVKHEIEQRCQAPSSAWVLQVVRIAVGTRPGTLVHKLRCAGRDRMSVFVSGAGPVLHRASAMPAT